MQVLVLSADWSAAWPKPFYPVVSNPVMTNTFANAPINGVAHTNTWGGEYSAINIATSTFRWDAITIGYGWVANALAIAGAHANDLMAIAIARARWLDAALHTRAGDGPYLKPAFGLVERTEQACIMFLAGQAMASLLGRTVWNAPRLFHASLFGPLLIPGYAALPYFAGADFICEVPGGPVGTFSSIEAKGRRLVFDPDSSSSHRLFLEEGLIQSATVGFTPYKNALSLAAFDASFPGRLVGQFWDPANENASKIPRAISNALKQKYFFSMMKFLNCFGEARLVRQSRFGEEVEWDCSPIGFTVSMQRSRFNRILQVDEGAISSASFSDWLDEQDKIYREQARPDERASIRYNQDGLALVSTQE